MYHLISRQYQENNLLLQGSSRGSDPRIVTTMSLIEEEGGATGMMDECPLRIKNHNRNEVIHEESREESKIIDSPLQLQKEAPAPYDSGIFIVTNTTFYGGE